MKNHLLLAMTGMAMLVAPAMRAETKVTVDYRNNDEATSAFAFKTVPHPSANDAATSAKFLIVDGEADSSGGDVEKLHDGKLPDEADQPDANFFFSAGSNGGRVQVDLGSAINVRQVNTYSWHPATRGPQNYRLYAADGTATNFNAKPKNGTSPDQCGWKLIATVNTKPKSEDGGGQYGVRIANPDGDLGKYRYLLFDISATERDDGFGNTFFSEIDVVDALAPAAHEIVAASADFTFKTADGKCTITLDTEQAPGLKDWAENKLAPVLAEWYPKITAQLPSEGYTAPDHFKITLKPMDGVAFTSGRNVVASSAWLEKELAGEALGSLVHELVHVVQQFHGGHNPGWLVEGSADYIRWFQYDAQQHGADMVWFRKHGKSFSPHYNDSYRITANFLNWVSEKYDQAIVTQMSAAMRDGKYETGLWEKYTGQTLEKLGSDWKQEVEAQLAAPAELKPAKLK